MSQGEYRSSDVEPSPRGERDELRKGLKPVQCAKLRRRNQLGLASGPRHSQVVCLVHAELEILLHLGYRHGEHSQLCACVDAVAAAPACGAGVGALQCQAEGLFGCGARRLKAEAATEA